ncbi:MAG TPA: hypothetical protein VGF73_13025 [Chthoniobacterales bacterium]
MRSVPDRQLRAARWERFLLLGLILLALLPTVQMWHWVASSWVPLPYWDEWHTPGSQFESWQRGTLTLAEMFSQHNESRLFFSRLLYFTLEHFGGWDVRKEIRVVFFGVCALVLLLLHLLWRTPGATPLSTLVGWALMMSVCFAPVQVENFLYGTRSKLSFRASPSWRWRRSIFRGSPIERRHCSISGWPLSRPILLQTECSSGSWPGRFLRLTNRSHAGGAAFGWYSMPLSG